MMLGKGVYLNLPGSCAKKAPSSNLLKSENDLSSIIVIKKNHSQGNFNKKINSKHQRTASIDCMIAHENDKRF